MRLTYAPRHHETVTVRTAGRLAGMRVILTEDGPLPSLVAYFLVPGNSSKSPSWQRKAAHAAGLLYDYIQARPPTPERLATGEYLSDFVRALSYGTMDEQWEDPTGLRWPPGTRAKVIETLRHVNAFTDWCAKTFGGAPANPMVTANYGERLAALRRIERQNAHSLLLHLRNARAVVDGSADDEECSPFRRRAVAVRPHKVASKRPPFFPAEYDARLFNEGFARQRVHRGEFWERFIIRDMMMALLYRYGGLRRSEPLHIFVGDVHRETSTGGARVLLFHPEDGESPPYRHPVSGQTTRSTRTAYLMALYGSQPRNRLVGSRRAGWKELMLEEGAPGYYANTHWLIEDASRLFWSLYQMYIRYVRPRDVNHPYLFCDQRGEPLKYYRTGEALDAAMLRIGLQPSKAAGTTHHGLRHAYGQDLTRAGVPEAIIQICMHHREVNSQRVYTAPEIAQISASLNAARVAIAADAHALSSPLLADATRALPR